MSWSSVSTALRALSKELQSERAELPRLHSHLVDVACARLKRAGKEGEKEAACKSVVSRCRRDLERLVEKEEQLGALLSALQSAQNAAAAGDLKHDQDWKDFIKRAVEDAQAFEYHEHLDQSVKKSLSEFDETCWRVNHAAEPLPGADAGDDDIVALSSGGGVLTLTDPFTKTLLEDPVRARQCGHRFSRQSITQFLQRKFAASRAAAASGALAVLDPAFAAPCQVAGCSKQVSLDSLVPDAAAARAIARMQAEERRQQRELEAAGADAAAANDARVEAAAAAAAKRARESAKRKRGTVKQEPEEQEGGPAVNDLTQQQEDAAAAGEGDGDARPVKAARQMRRS